MRASIVSIGSEILRGSLLDTNAQYFAQELNAIGGTVVRVTQVPDILEDIVDGLRRTGQLSDLVIVSGGLGPTEDDLTREALITLTGESAEVDEFILDEIRSRFRLRGAEMPDRNAKQAWKIPSAEIIPNDNGTALGWLITKDGTIFAALPGPPRENRPMWRNLVRPAIIPKSQTAAVVSRTIKTIGLGESSVADRICNLMERGWPDIGTYAKHDGVHVTVTATHPERVEAERAVREAMDAAVRQLGDSVYGEGDESLASAIAQPVAAAGIRMAIWEAGAGGTLMSLFLSDDLARGIIADARAWPTREAYAGTGTFTIRKFARDAARQSGVSTAGVLAIRDAPTPPDGHLLIEAALAHAGEVVSQIQQTRGTAAEVRRRSIVFSAGFFRSEIRRLAGLDQDADIANPNARI